MTTLQVRGFESTGLSREQAEALTRHLTELICTNKEKITESFVTKFSMEKVLTFHIPIRFRIEHELSSLHWKHGLAQTLAHVHQKSGLRQA